MRKTWKQGMGFWSGNVDKGWNEPNLFHTQGGGWVIVSLNVFLLDIKT
jgi:hypothetical protein